jgi:hypothetical protein
VKQRRPCELLHQVTLLRIETDHHQQKKRSTRLFANSLDCREQRKPYPTCIETWTGLTKPCYHVQGLLTLNYMLSITISLGLGFKMGTKTKLQTQLQYSCRVEKPKLLMFCNM